MKNLQQILNTWTEIDPLGGPAKAARTLGVSPSTVRRIRRGEVTRPHEGTIIALKESAKKKHASLLQAGKDSAPVFREGVLDPLYSLSVEAEHHTSRTHQEDDALASEEAPRGFSGLQRAFDEREWLAVATALDMVEFRTWPAPWSGRATVWRLVVDNRFRDLDKARALIKVGLAEIKQVDQRADLLANAALTELQAGEFLRALQYAEQGLELVPSHRTATYNALCAASRLGDLERCERLWGRLMTLSADYESPMTERGRQVLGDPDLVNWLRSERARLACPELAESRRRADRADRADEPQGSGGAFGVLALLLLGAIGLVTGKSSQSATACFGESCGGAKATVVAAAGGESCGKASFDATRFYSGESCGAPMVRIG